MREQYAVREEHFQKSKTGDRINHMLDLVRMDLVQYDIVIDQIAFLVLVAGKPIMPADMAFRGDKYNVHAKFTADIAQPLRKHTWALGFRELDFSHH
ncbi:hypothetical protein D3C81_1097990 [compost metagenome]